MSVMVKKTMWWLLDIIGWLVSRTCVPEPNPPVRLMQGCFHKSSGNVYHPNGNKSTQANGQMIFSGIADPYNWQK